jgi:EAL and modified HD-GYP domain-containing signal transduction protein
MPTSEDTILSRIRSRESRPLPAQTASGVNRDAATEDLRVGFRVVGRQGIYRSDRSTEGYELRLSPKLVPATPEPPTADGPVPTELLVDQLSVELDELIGGHRLFVNVDPGQLTEPWELWLPPNRTVIELSHVEVDDEFLAHCASLRDHGFSLALDGFEWFDGAEPLLALASIVKIDLTRVVGAERAELVARCRSHGVELLADKVQDQRELAPLHDAGFLLFQGVALERPQVTAGREVPRNALARLRAAVVLLDGDVEVAQLEEIIRTEPGMAYQVVRLASIGRLGETRRTVSTLRQAIVLLGVRRTQHVLAVLLARPPGGKWRSELITTLARARACELLLGRIDRANKPLGFAVGLISAFDRVLGIPLVEIIDSMSLSDELRTALLDPTSEIGTILADLISYEYGDHHQAPRSRITQNDLDDVFGEGFAWAAYSLSPH